MVDDGDLRQQPPERGAEAGKAGCVAGVVALGLMVLVGRITGGSISLKMLLAALAIGAGASLATYLKKPEVKA